MMKRSLLERRIKELEKRFPDPEADKELTFEFAFENEAGEVDRVVKQGRAWPEDPVFRVHVVNTRRPRPKCAVFDFGTPAGGGGESVDKPQAVSVPPAVEDEAAKKRGLQAEIGGVEEPHK